MYKCIYGHAKHFMNLIHFNSSQSLTLVYNSLFLLVFKLQWATSFCILLRNIHIHIRLHMYLLSIILQNFIRCLLSLLKNTRKVHLYLCSCQRWKVFLDTVVWQGHTNICKQTKLYTICYVEAGVSLYHIALLDFGRLLW